MVRVENTAPSSQTVAIRLDPLQKPRLCSLKQADRPPKSPRVVSIDRNSVSGDLADRVADMGKLTAIGVKRATDGKYHDGNGLELRKKGDGGRWVWRYSFAGKRREMGLGSYPAAGELFAVACSKVANEMVAIRTDGLCRRP